VDEPLSLDERIARLLQQCQGSSPYLQGQRAYVGHALEAAEPEILARPEVRALLAELREDPVDWVRAAAAWSGQGAAR
jgi:hypothetical protein